LVDSLYGLFFSACILQLEQIFDFCITTTPDI
jgi:hypothetical protein